VSFCELTRTKRCGSNCELWLAANAAVYVVAAFEQIAEDGQELGFLELVQSNTEAPKVGIEPSGDQQTHIPEQDTVGELLKGLEARSPVFNR
jgi:hypothetical protein